MTTLPIESPRETMRHATDGVLICGMPMSVGTMPEPGCIRDESVPSTPTTSTWALRKVLTSSVPFAPTTTSRRSRSSFTVRVAVPTGGNETSSPPAHATCSRSGDAPPVAW